MHVYQTQVMMQLHAKVLPLAASMVSTACRGTLLHSFSRLPMIFSSLCRCGHTATLIRTASQGG